MSRKNNALTLERVVKARCLVSDLTAEHAKLICNRNLTVTQRGVRFCSDPKLKLRSLVRLTEPQVIDILSSISTTCLIVIGERGFPLINQSLKLDIFRKANFNVLELVGGHHVHMDNAVETARSVVKFVNN